MSGKEFIKESFKNGNRYTNIGVTLIFLLVAIIGFFLRGIYSEFKEVQTLIHKHDIKIEVMEANLKNHTDGQNKDPK